jgi:hypothetical protein
MPGNSYLFLENENTLFEKKKKKKEIRHNLYHLQD